MANITFDFSVKEVVQPSKELQENSKNFIYRDIATSKLYLKTNRIGGEEFVKESDASWYDAAAIKNSLNNILNFKSGENILDPKFGIGDVYQMLYTPFDKHTTEKMLKTIRRIIADYEPRIEVISIPTTYDEDKQEYHMTINYYIPSLLINDTMEYYLTK